MVRVGFGVECEARLLLGVRDGFGAWVDFGVGKKLGWGLGLWFDGVGLGPLLGSRSQLELVWEKGSGLGWAFILLLA